MLEVWLTAFSSLAREKVWLGGRLATIAGELGRKATKQTNKQNMFCLCETRYHSKFVQPLFRSVKMLKNDLCPM